MINYRKHPSLSDRGDSVLIIIDIQEKLYPYVKNPNFILNVSKIIKTSQLLDIPVITTEQEKLGRTIEPLRQVLGKSYNPINKMSFSCFDNEDFRERLKELKKKTCILTGIEGHICVQQTALDLSHNDYVVHVVEDAVSSRNEIDLSSALNKMRSSGIIITTTETVMYELMRTADDERFKRFLEIVKSP
jgi:nicotinamidase-related amidase